MSIKELFIITIVILRQFFKDTVHSVDNVSDEIILESHGVRSSSLLYDGIYVHMCIV